MYKPYSLIPATRFSCGLLWLLSILFPQITFSQSSSQIDSLLQVIEIPQHDTSRVNTLIDLSSRLSRKSQNEKAKKYAADALSMANALKYKNGISDAYNVLGIVYTNESNYPEALKNHMAAFKIRKEIGDKKRMASSYNNIGNIFFYQSNYAEAMTNFTSALKLREEIGDKRGIAESYNSLGGISCQQGDLTQGLKYFHQSLAIKIEIGNKIQIASSYKNIGTLYRIQGNYSEALKNFMTGLKIDEEIGDQIGLAHSYDNIGDIYYYQGSYTEALKNFQAARKISEETGDQHELAYALNCIGNTYSVQRNFSEALKYLEASKKIKQEIGDQSGLSTSYRSIGYIYKEQGNFPEALKSHLFALTISAEIGELEGKVKNFESIGVLHMLMRNFPEARIYLDSALALAFDIGLKSSICDTYADLADLDSIQDNHQQALQHYKLHVIYRDSLLDETHHGVIVELQTKYETEKKDKEIQVLENEKQIRDLEFITVRSEKDKAQIQSLFHLQQFDLLAKDKDLQQCALEQNQASLTLQENETVLKQDQLNLLNKEHEIQRLALRKEKITKSYLLTGIALFALLSFMAYSNFITRQKLKLQTLRNKIASDLHDDVGSTLSSIFIFSEIARQQSKEVIPMLDTIGESSKKMLDAMADIVWTINPENDAFEMIIDRMRSFAYDLLGAKKIEFEFEADEQLAQLKLPMAVRKNLYLIFKEAANNMVKYSNADKAYFAIHREAKVLTLLVRDNGRGFDLNEVSKGNGLNNMRKRAEEMGGKLEIESGPGIGTSIQLKIAV